MKYMIKMKPGEVAYTALPLYHTFASQVGITGEPSRLIFRQNLEQCNFTQ